MNSSHLHDELYTYGEVDRFLSLTSGTARRWINGYQRDGTYYPPVVRVQSLGEDRLVTWGEMVEVFYLASFRGQRHPLQHLREVVLRLREQHGDYPFAQQRVLFSDKVLSEVVRVVTGDMVEVVRTGQYSFIEDPTERLQRVEFSAGIARSFAPKVDLPEIIIMGSAERGAPLIADTRIRPHSVARLVQAGDPIERVAKWYDLTPEKVDQAGRFTYGSKWRLAA